MWRRLSFLVGLTRAHTIARRYFVTNGFDGALTMLGLTIGFYAGGGVAIPVMISACLGAAIALTASGLVSAYMSETAEREKELRELEQALIRDLEDTEHARAARLVPLLVAGVNGFAPLLIALLVIVPLWLAEAGVALPLGPLECAIIVAFASLFFLGAFLGRIGGRHWLWSGLRMLFVAVVTALVILAVAD